MNLHLNKHLYRAAKFYGFYYHLFLKRNIRHLIIKVLLNELNIYRRRKKDNSKHKIWRLRAYINNIDFKREKNG